MFYLNMVAHEILVTAQRPIPFNPFLILFGLGLGLGLGLVNFICIIIILCSVTPDSGPSQLSIILSVSTVMAQTSNARLWNVRIYQVRSSLDWIIQPLLLHQYQYLKILLLPSAADSIKTLGWGIGAGSYFL